MYGVWFEYRQADPPPFNLCSNAGSTHTSISQTQPLDIMLSSCIQLVGYDAELVHSTCLDEYGEACSDWNPNLSCLTAVWSWPSCCSSVSGSWQSSYSLRHLYVEQQFFVFFQILREFIAMRLKRKQSMKSQFSCQSNYLFLSE